MIADRRARLAGALALCAALASPLAAKDVYREFLDPAIPQHRAALDLLARLEKTPDDASLHNDLACLIARDGFWRDALGEFDVAAKLDKTDSRPLYNAGLVHTTRGEWGSAASSFRKATVRAPRNSAAWWMLGYAEERRGRDSAAVAAYKKSLRADSAPFDVRKNPFAAYSLLKGRVMLESYDEKLHLLALPASEQLAQVDLVTSFQKGRVSLSAVPGPPVAGGAPSSPVSLPVSSPGAAASPSMAMPPAAPSPNDQGARPGPGGPVVISVPPVSASRPAPPPGSAVSAPTPVPPPTMTRANEPIPADFPTQSPAGPAPPKRGPGPGFGGGAPVEPTPTPP